MFKHAIFYQIDARTFASSKPDSTTGDLKGITQRLDYIHSLNVDATLLKPIDSISGCPTEIVTGGRRTKVHCVSSGMPPTVATPPIDPALGTLDDFDDLTLQASRLKIRILLELPTPDAAVARFWLTRGVAGFYVPGSASANSAAIDAIRKLLPTFVGQRVLITEADLAATHSSPNDLLLDRTVLQPTVNPVPGLRAALDQSQTLLHSGTPILAIDSSSTPAPHLARILATVALLNRSATLITAGQELGFVPPPGNTALLPWGQSPQSTSILPEDSTEAAKPDPAKPAPASVASSPDKYTPYVPYVRPSAAPKKAAPPDPATAAGQDMNPNSLLNFYRALGRIHHGTMALRDGAEIVFNHDDLGVLIWMRKPSSPSQANPAVLIACNLSEKSVVLSLKSDVARLQLRGTFLRTILRSDDLMGGVSLDPITLPPYGVYVGTLRY